MSIFHEIAAQKIDVERREYYSELWGRKIYSRPFSAFKYQKLQKSVDSASDIAFYTAKTVQLAVEDENGVLIFRGHKKEDRENTMDYLMGKAYKNEKGELVQSNVTFDHLLEILNGLKHKADDDDLQTLIDEHKKKSKPIQQDS